MFIIYKTTQPQSGRYYIGRHTTEDLNDGYYGSGRWVRSVDRNTLVTGVLHFTETEQELIELETKVIEEHINDPLCMNWTTDSRGWRVAPTKDPVKREKMRQSLREYYKKHTNPFKDKKHTPETKNLMREKALERAPESQETRAKKSKAHTGKKRTETHKKNMSKAALNRTDYRSIRCVETGVVYRSMLEAKRETGVNELGIGRVCKGTQKTAGGYHWEYLP